MPGASPNGTLPIRVNGPKPVVPPIDDALAEKIGFDKLEDLRDTLDKMRQRRLDGLTRMRLKRDLLDLLAERATFADTHLSLGMFPGWGGAALLAEAVAFA